MFHLEESLSLIAEDLQLITGDELFDLDITNDDPWALAQSVGVTILSDKDFFAGYVDMDWENGVIIAAAFTSLVDRTFSFDVVVHRKYQNRGLGKKLIDMCMDEFNWLHSDDLDVTLALDVVNERLVPFLEREYGLKVKLREGDHLIMGKIAGKGRWKQLARHRWVHDAVITESIFHDPSDPEVNKRRFTATIHGFRNWKVYEGEPGIGNEVADFVRAIADKIDEFGEDIIEIYSANLPNAFARSKEKLIERTRLVESLSPESMKTEDDTII